MSFVGREQDMTKYTDLCSNQCWLQSTVMSLLHYNLIITPVPTLHFLILTHRDPAVLVIDTNIVPLPGNSGLGVTPGRDALQYSRLSGCHHHVIGRLAEIIPENYGRLRQVLALCCVVFVFVCAPLCEVFIHGYSLRNLGTMSQRWMRRLRFFSQLLSSNLLCSFLHVMPWLSHLINYKVFSWQNIHIKIQLNNWPKKKRDITWLGVCSKT